MEYRNLASPKRGGTIHPEVIDLRQVLLKTFAIQETSLRIIIPSGLKNKLLNLINLNL